MMALRNLIMQKPRWQSLSPFTRLRCYENFASHHSSVVCLRFPKLSHPFKNAPATDYIDAYLEYGRLSRHGKLSPPACSTHKCAWSPDRKPSSLKHVALQVVLRIHAAHFLLIVWFLAPKIIHCIMSDSGIN